MTLYKNTLKPYFILYSFMFFRERKIPSLPIISSLYNLFYIVQMFLVRWLFLLPIPQEGHIKIYTVYTGTNYITM